MARYVSSICAIALGVGLAAGTARAQPLVILPDHVTIGGGVAASTTVADNGAPRSPALWASLDLPVFTPFRVRIDAGRAQWRFGREPSNGGRGVENGTFSHATVSLIKVVSPRRLDMPLAAYVGAGIGVYRYRLRSDQRSPLRRGLNALAGIELTLPNQRVVLAWEAQAHLGISGSIWEDEYYQPIVLRLAMAARYRF